MVGNCVYLEVAGGEKPVTRRVSGTVMVASSTCEGSVKPRA